jgi:hypothetical protein
MEQVGEFAAQLTVLQLSVRPNAPEILIRLVSSLKFGQDCVAYALAVDHGESEQDG